MSYVRLPLRSPVQSFHPARFHHHHTSRFAFPHHPPFRRSARLSTSFNAVGPSLVSHSETFQRPSIAPPLRTSREPRQPELLVASCPIGRPLHSVSRAVQDSSLFRRRPGLSLSTRAHPAQRDRISDLAVRISQRTQPQSCRYHSPISVSTNLQASLRIPTSHTTTPGVSAYMSNLSPHLTQYIAAVNPKDALIF